LKVWKVVSRETFFDDVWGLGVGVDDCYTGAVV